MNFSRKNNQQRKVPARLLIVLNFIRSTDRVKNIFLNDFMFASLVEIETDNLTLFVELKQHLIHTAISDSTSDVAVRR